MTGKLFSQLLSKPTPKNRHLQKLSILFHNYCPKLIAGAEAEMIKIACGPCPEGHVRWTLRLLAEQAKVVLDEPVSKDTIGRALKK